jgi:hypothetical protein
MRADRRFGAESPTIEVVAFRHGQQIGRELCDTPEEAALAVEQWSEQHGVTCQVDDLAVHHTAADVRDPSPDDGVDDGREADPS